MADMEPIRNEADCETALARIDELMGAEPGSPEGRELDVLVDLVDLYETRHEPMGYPDPVAAIDFRMEQSDVSPRDVIPCIGSRTKVSEVLSGKVRARCRWRGRSTSTSGSPPMCCCARRTTLTTIRWRSSTDAGCRSDGSRNRLRRRLPIIRRRRPRKP